MSWKNHFPVPENPGTGIFPVSGSGTSDWKTGMKPEFTGKIRKVFPVPELVTGKLEKFRFRYSLPERERESEIGLSLISHSGKENSKKAAS